ncbi:MAG: UbiD family decarboxylase [Thermoplasmataceae archaeon]|jgi:UbiD family decarboxylase
MGDSFRKALTEYFQSEKSDTRIIDEEVDTRFETTAISFLNGTSVSLFKRLKGYSHFNLISNILGSEERILFFSGSRTRADFLRRWKKALSMDIDSSEMPALSRAPFRERILTGSDVDLNVLPVPEHFSNDGSKLAKRKYITSGLLITRNPENKGILNMGYGRIQILGKSRFAFDCGSKGHTWSYIRKNMDNGEATDFSVVIGTHPIFYLLGAAFIEDEFHRAREFIDFDVAEGYMNGIPVPADAEIVIEATHNPGEIIEEGPFGEYTGYMGYDTTGFTASCKSIMYRNNAIYYDILPSNSMEHVNNFSYPRSLLIESRIAESLPGNSQLKIEWPHYASRFLALGYAESGAGSIAMQAACGIVAQDPLWAKFVLIYRKKSSLELQGFLAAIAASSEHAFSNITILPESFIISSDVSSGGIMKSSRLLAQLDPCHYKVRKFRDHLIIDTGKHSCLISHGHSEGLDLEIYLPDDIDLEDFSKIGWAISTRVDPGRDISISGGRMVMDSRRAGAEIPVMNVEALKNAERVVEAYSKNGKIMVKRQNFSPFS